MFFKSIRFKITLWYVVFLTFILCGSGFAVYQSLNQRLRAHVDNILQVRAEGIADSIDTYWETEKGGAGGEGTGDVAPSKSDDVHFVKIAQRWVLERSADPDLLNIIVQVFNANGALLASSKNIDQPVDLDKGLLRSALEGSGRFDEISAAMTPGKPLVLRTLTLPIIENRRMAYIVRVLSPLSSVATALKDLRFILFLLLPLTVLVGGIVGSFMAKLTLSPINRMVDAARRISADNLRLRIRPPTSHDEIGRLADTFNAMLGRLEHGFSSQRRFLDDLAHELKTPLSVIKGELEVTQKRVRSTQEYTSTLDSNLEEINRLIRLVDDLLVLARLDRSVVSLEMKPLDFGGLVEGMVHVTRTLADEKGVDLQLLPGAACRVLGDENNLKRLVLNILDNALKFTPSGGHVRVGVVCEHGAAKVTVADTGIGIPVDALPHVFERFYRAENSRDSAGLGLGLSIAMSIAEAHQGRIDVQSSPGQGSVFTILIPASILFPPRQA
jgi:heavy metal sensor kinase